MCFGEFDVCVSDRCWRVINSCLKYLIPNSSDFSQKSVAVWLNPVFSCTTHSKTGGDIFIDTRRSTLLGKNW